MNSSSSSSSRTGWNALGWIAGGMAVLFLSALVTFGILSVSQVQVAQGQSLWQWLFAMNSQQTTWYVTRAAGMMAYLLLWLSTAWGLAVPSRILDGLLHGSFTFDFHQFVSLLAIAFLGVHMGVLLIDQYAPFSLTQLIFPFTSDYRPLWVGIGTVSMYMIALVTITFYLRNRIGMKIFRAIHVLSLLGFVGAALHGLMSGTDSPLPMVQVMYAGTFLSVVFLMAYWLIGVATKKRRVAVVRAR